jgi:hypothetical protein
MKLKRVLAIYNIMDNVKRCADALERLAPAGSESRVLLPDPRSGVGDKTTTMHGSETPFPDRRRWSEAEVERASELYQAGDKAFAYSIEDVARELNSEFGNGRTPAAVMAKLRRHYNQRRRATREPRSESGNEPVEGREGETPESNTTR